MPSLSARSRDRFSRSRSRQFARDDSGATAIEFAAVATPFLMLVFALIGVAFYFFIMNSMEKGMDQTGRLVRTGQAQQTEMTVQQFRQSICDRAGAWIKCDKLQVFPDRSANWNLVQPKPCVINGVVQTSPANDSDKIADYVGASSAIVVVTACYHWEFATLIPYLKFGNMPDGTHMIQAATAFRTEPYGS